MLDVPDGRTASLTIRLTPELLTAIRARADAEHRSVSNMARLLLAEAMNDRKAKR